MPWSSRSLAGDVVVAEVLQQQPERGAGILAGGQRGKPEHGDIGLVVAPPAVEAAGEGVEEVAIAQRRPLEPLALVSWRISSARSVRLLDAFPVSNLSARPPRQASPGPAWPRLICHFELR
jgi:hypothetical protein